MNRMYCLIKKKKINASNKTYDKKVLVRLNIQVPIL